MSLCVCGHQVAEHWGGKGACAETGCRCEQARARDHLVDPADRHAFAMFTAGWIAACRSLLPDVDELDRDADDGDVLIHETALADTAWPSAEDFYLAVPDRAQRECPK